jgi:hypothetical protein
VTQPKGVLLPGTPFPNGRYLFHTFLAPGFLTITIDHQKKSQVMTQDTHQPAIESTNFDTIPYLAILFSFQNH